MPEIIDCHAHWIPPQLAEALRARSSVPNIERTSDGEVLVTWLGRRPLRPLCDLEARRADMAKNDISMQVLSLPGLFGIDCLPLDEALPLVRAFNDAAVALMRADAERFVALAALPFADVDAACCELQRVLGLGIRGAILPADGFVTRAAAERFTQLFENGARFGAHFFIHPGPLDARTGQSAHGANLDQEWQRWIVLETQARLSQAMVTLNLTDYLDPYVGVTVQVANLGGAIPFFIERMDAVCRNHSEPLASARMRRCYVDTASFGPRAIAMATECFGPERLLFGTDCPIFDVAQMRAAVEAVHLDHRSRVLALASNARAIFVRNRDNPASEPGTIGPSRARAR